MRCLGDMANNLITRQQITELLRRSHRAAVRACCDSVLDYMRTLRRETIETASLPAPLKQHFA